MCIWKKRRISKINRHENNIGNHAAAVFDSGGVASRTEYAAYELNQYASVGDFVPQFDADGNQTLLKTGTGVWQVEYNAENRPVRFTRIEGTSTSVVECAYDSMGRRATKQVTVNGSITLHQRYLYRSYLQIACVDLTRAAHPALWYITWDPTQPVATRPLAIQLNGTWFTYGWDLTKNICEVYGQHGYIRTAYTYSPYGEVTAAGDVTQPIQWSSEYNDTELGLIYYNYRHYNPVDGRWMGRDRIGERGGMNLYRYVANNAIALLDSLGLDYTIDIDSKTCSITYNMELVVSFDNTVDETHQKTLLQRIEKTIEEEWDGYKKGCCSISVNVTIVSSTLGKIWTYIEDLFSCKGRKSNSINVTYQQTAGYMGSRSYATGDGDVKNKAVFINTAAAATAVAPSPRDCSETWAWAHEAGHLMGLLDGYDKHTNEILPGYKGDEMMAADRNSVKIDDIKRLTAGVVCPCSPQNEKISKK